VWTEESVVVDCELVSRMTMLLFVLVVVGGVFTIIGAVALCARCRSVLKHRCPLVYLTLKSYTNIKIKLEHRCSTEHKPHAGRRCALTSSPAATNGPVCCCITLFAARAFQLGGNLSLVTLTFDLWPWYSKSSERGTKYVFPVNLAQIRSAIPDISHTQTNKKKQKKSNTQR